MDCAQVRVLLASRLIRVVIGQVVSRGATLVDACREAVAQKDDRVLVDPGDTGHVARYIVDPRLKRVIIGSQCDSRNLA